MSDDALNPFPPIDFGRFLPAGVSSVDIVVWGLYLVFAFWVVYTIVALYHWLTYSHASWLAFPAIAVHIFVSLVLMSYALSGDISLLQRVLYLT